MQGICYKVLKSLRKPTGDKDVTQSWSPWATLTVESLLPLHRSHFVAVAGDTRAATGRSHLQLLQPEIEKKGFSLPPTF